jgi:hypothetical protein
LLLVIHIGAMASGLVTKTVTDPVESFKFQVSNSAFFWVKKWRETGQFSEEEDCHVEEDCK